MFTKELTEGSLIKSHWLGRLSYKKWLFLQEDYFQKVSQDLSSFIFGLEHESTITVGLSSHRVLKNEILVSHQELESQKIKVLKVFRGGKTALHAPGQLMIYPIVHLHQLDLKLRFYIDLLFQTTLRFLKIYKISGFLCRENPGIYTKKGKIAFLGLRINRGISSYGMAINVFNDLSLFSFIKACGGGTNCFDSMENYGVSNHLRELFSSWINEFLKTLKESY